MNKEISLAAWNLEAIHLTETPTQMSRFSDVNPVVLDSMLKRLRSGQAKNAIRLPPTQLNHHLLLISWTLFRIGDHRVPDGECFSDKEIEMDYQLQSGGSDKLVSPTHPSKSPPSAYLLDSLPHW